MEVRRARSGPGTCDLFARHGWSLKRRASRDQDARNQAALAEAADIPEADLPSFAALTAEEQVLVRRVLGSALGSDDAGVA